MDINKNSSEIKFCKIETKPFSPGEFIINLFKFITIHSSTLKKTNETNEIDCMKSNFYCFIASILKFLSVMIISIDQTTGFKVQRGS